MLVSFLCRTRAALRHRPPAVRACGLFKNKRPDTLTDGSFIQPSSLPFSPSRSEESAVQAGGRRAEERQEALRRSEPAAAEQRRGGHVMKEREREEGEERARRRGGSERGEKRMGSVTS